MDHASADDSGIDNFGDLSLSEGREENLPAEEIPVPIAKTAKSTTSELPGEAPTREAQESESLSESDLSKELLVLHWTKGEREAYYRSLEDKAFKKYSLAEPEGHFVCGKDKKSFCYLLLDPRVTQDLPRRGTDLPVEKRWRIFLEAVFYVGKGSGERPFLHLKNAKDSTESGQSADEEKLRIRRILDIGKKDQGVVCLVVFPWVMHEEACTREACMIEAFKASRNSHLTNIRKGTYYGDAKAMSLDKKLSLGRHLLYKSMEIFMRDGERQQPPQKFSENNTDRS